MNNTVELWIFQSRNLLSVVWKWKRNEINRQMFYKIAEVLLVPWKMYWPETISMPMTIIMHTSYSIAKRKKNCLQ